MNSKWLHFSIPCSALNIINSAVCISAVLISFQSGCVLEAWERSKLCNLGAEVIRPNTRCFSFLGHWLVPLLGVLFMAPIWHLVFWQEPWRLPRATMLKLCLHTAAPIRHKHVPRWSWHTRVCRSTSAVVCYTVRHLEKKNFHVFRVCSEPIGVMCQTETNVRAAPEGSNFTFTLRLGGVSLNAKTTWRRCVNMQPRSHPVFWQPWPKGHIPCQRDGVLIMHVCFCRLGNLLIKKGSVVFFY